MMVKLLAEKAAPAVLTVREAVKRAKQDGMTVSEYALRSWIRQGVLPVRKSGNRSLIFYPKLLEFLSFQESKGFGTAIECVKHDLQKKEISNGQRNT